jgi:dihydroorotate dehydrogenase (NAD+) catalytic subunit
MDGDFPIEPGQFVFAAIPIGSGYLREKPYSLYNDSPATLLVRRRVGDDGSPGFVSNKLADMDAGDTLLLRGPCGNPVDLTDVKHAVLVGGGTGVAALSLTARQLKRSGAEVLGFVGAKDRDHIVYLHECADGLLVFYATEDGSVGHGGMRFRGTVTELMSQALDPSRSYENTTFFNCGPEPMITKAELIERGYVSVAQIFSSVERLARCGYGLCGECAREDGLRLCVDGPFMNPSG